MTTETTTAPSLDDLKKLLAAFSAADVKKLLKEAEAAKPTLVSLTMDAIVSAGMSGAVITDNVQKEVTARALAAGVLKSGENASVSSIGALIRYTAAYDAALQRAGLEIVKVVVAEPEPVPTPEPEEQPKHRRAA